MSKVYAWATAFNIPPSELQYWQTQIISGETLLQYALRNNRINEQIYIQWAKNYYGYAALKESFFQKPIDPTLWEQFGALPIWSSRLMPIKFWDNCLYIAGIEKPDEELEQRIRMFLPNSSFQFIIAPYSGLSSWWSILERFRPAARATSAPASIPSAAPSMPTPPVMPQVPNMENHSSTVLQNASQPVLQKQNTDDPLNPNLSSNENSQIDPQNISFSINTVSNISSEKESMPSTTSTPQSAPASTIETTTHIEANVGATSNNKETSPVNASADPLLNFSWSPNIEVNTSPEAVAKKKNENASFDMFGKLAADIGVADSSKISNNEDSSVKSVPDIVPAGLNLNEIKIDFANITKTETDFSSISAPASESSITNTVPNAPILNDSSNNLVNHENSAFGKFELKLDLSALQSQNSQPNINQELHKKEVHQAVAQMPPSPANPNESSYPSINFGNETSIKEQSFSKILPGKMSEVQNIDDLAQFCFQKMQPEFEKQMILLLEKDHLVPWKWSAQWQINPSMNQIVETQSNSIFRVVMYSKRPYHGFVVANQINSAFFTCFNNAKLPEHCTIVPIQLQNNIIGLMLGICSKAQGEVINLAHYEELAKEFSIHLMRLQQSMMLSAS